MRHFDIIKLGGRGGPDVSFILSKIHLCPGSNAVTNFTNFTIFRFSCICNKICAFLLNSTTNFMIFRNCVQSWTSLPRL